MRSMNRPNLSHAACGFTLIELVLVLFIIAVLGAIAAPRFTQATSSSRLNAAADRIAADFELARARARASSQSVTIAFSGSAERYQVSGGGGDTFKVELDESPYNVTIRRIKFNGTKQVTFNGYGIPSSGGSLLIENGSDSLTLSIDENGQALR